MSASARVLLDRCRHPNRLRSSHLIERAIKDFKRMDSPDAALIAGTGMIGRQNIMIFAQEKPQGRDGKRAAAINYGMMTATGYWYVVEQLEQAAKSGQGVLYLIDTPGADPSKAGSENLLAWSISAAVRRLLTYDGPTVSVLIGEGGSGGALALQVADRRLMVDDAIYSTISPESCSAILFRSSDQIEKAMAILRPSADEVIKTGIMDDIIRLPEELMFTNHDEAARLIGQSIQAAFADMGSMTSSQRLRRRADKYLACGKLAHSLPKPKLKNASEAKERRPSALPAMEKFSRITSNDGEISAIRNAYFLAKSGRAASPEEAQDILCPRDRGGCGTLFSEAAYIRAGWACPSCNRGERLTSDHWIELLCGNLPFEELYADLDLSDLDHAGYDNPEYSAQRRKAREKLGIGESLRVGIGYIDDRRCAIAVSDFRFFGGTLGAAAGEKLWRLCQLAREEHLPLVAVTCSGGVRMQDGTLGLAQMAKTVAAVNLLMESNLCFVSILADPCTGGALGSYATIANSILAEPQALVAFAGPRVMRLAGLPVNEATMVSDRFVEYGGVDETVPRNRLRSRVLRYLQLKPMQRRRNAVSAPAAPAMQAETPIKEIASWFDDLVARAGGVLQDYQDAAANASSMVHAQASVVARLADLALISVPLLLEQAAHSANHRVRANAVEALARFPAQDTAQLFAALGDEHHRVRSNAALGLLRHDPQMKEARAVLEQLLDSQDAIQRRAGLFALTRTPVSHFRERVRALCRDEDIETGICAAIALYAFEDIHFANDNLGRMLDKIGEAGERRSRKMLQFMPDAGAKHLRLFLEQRAV